MFLCSSTSTKKDEDEYSYINDWRSQSCLLGDVLGITTIRMDTTISRKDVVHADAALGAVFFIGTTFATHAKYSATNRSGHHRLSNTWRAQPLRDTTVMPEQTQQLPIPPHALRTREFRLSSQAYLTRKCEKYHSWGEKTRFVSIVRVLAPETSNNIKYERKIYVTFVAQHALRDNDGVGRTLPERRDKLHVLVARSSNDMTGQSDMLHYERWRWRHA